MSNVGYSGDLEVEAAYGCQTLPYRAIVEISRLLRG